MNLRLIGVLLLLIVLSACETEIEGRIVDNFEQPVSGVTVKIIDSAYECISEENGEFRIPFSAGMVSMLFEKENYQTKTKYLQINDAKDYPLGVLKMKRLPSSKGVFVKGDSNYIEIPKVIFNKEKKIKNVKSFFGYRKQTSDYFTFDDKDVAEIRPYNIDELNLLNNLGTRCFVFKAKDNYAFSTREGLSRMPVITDGEKVGAKDYKWKDGIIVSQFKPEVGHTYVAVEYKGDFMIETKVESGYLFKVIQ